MANTWITNLVSGLRIAGSLKLLSLGFSPADIVALITSSAVFVPNYGYAEAA
jgi:hypothetical protein